MSWWDFITLHAHGNLRRSYLCRKLYRPCTSLQPSPPQFAFPSQNRWKSDLKEADEVPEYHHRLMVSNESTTVGRQLWRGIEHVTNNLYRDRQAVRYFLRHLADVRSSWRRRINCKIDPIWVVKEFSGIPLIASPFPGYSSLFFQQTFLPGILKCWQSTWHVAVWL